MPDTDTNSNTAHIYDLDEKLNQSILKITAISFERILKLEEPSDCLSLYMFYINKSRIEKNKGFQPDAVWATGNYCASGLKLSEKRIREAKKQLTAAGLIKDVEKRDSKSGKITGHYIRVNYALNIKEEIQDIPIESEEQKLEDIAAIFEKPKDKFFKEENDTQLQEKLKKAKTKINAKQVKSDYMFIKALITEYKSVYMEKYKVPLVDDDMISQTCMNKIARKITTWIDIASEISGDKIDNKNVLIATILKEMFWKASGKNGVFPLDKNRATIQLFSKHIDAIIANTL